MGADRLEKQGGIGERRAYRAELVGGKRDKGKGREAFMEKS